MKNTIKYITLLSLGLLACEPEFDQPIEDTPAAAQESGDADFSTFVALGDSLTAGIADGALYIDGQNNSFANMIATQMQAAGGGAFTTPLMADNIGGFVEDPAIYAPRLILDAVNLAPVPVEATPTTSLFNIQPGPYNNMGIPGAKSFHLLGDIGNAYGNPAGLQTTPATANPYYVRMASSPTTSPLTGALAQQPTFFSLWIGANDVLGYATSGGDSSEGDFITPEGTFKTLYDTMVAALAAPVEAGGAGAKGLLVNIPSVSSLPFFTTVSSQLLVLTAEQADDLTQFFSGFANVQAILNADPSFVPKYSFVFNEGANGFIISTEVTDDNPLGLKKATPQDLLLLTIDQNALRTENYGSVVVNESVLSALTNLAINQTVTPEEGLAIISAVNPIVDGDVLDTSEIEEIARATDAYNTTIQNAATTFDLALYDAASRLADLSDGGISVNGSLVTNAFASGGFFSLDGIHLSPKGNGITANEMIETINRKYGSTLQPVQTRDLPSVYIQ